MPTAPRSPSIEAYERSHELADAPVPPARRDRGGEHVGEEEGEVVEEETTEAAGDQGGVQVVPPSMR